MPALPTNLTPSSKQQVFTLVQHSGAATGHTEFERAVESRTILDVDTARKIHDAGGRLFDSYGAAEDAAEALNYPPGSTGIIPNLPPGGSWFVVAGLHVYIPPSQEHDAPEPVIIRNGASVYTADELTMLFVDDAVSLGAVCSTTGTLELAHSRSVLASGRDAVSGSMTYPDSAEGVLAQDRANHMAQQLETDLHTVDRPDGGTGYTVTWDDDYVIRPLCSHPACIDNDQHEEG